MRQSVALCSGDGRPGLRLRTSWAIVRILPNAERKDSGLKTCSSNACLARVLGQNKGFCLSWLIVNKQRKMTVFGSLLRIEIDLVSSSISKVFAQQGVQ